MNKLNCLIKASLLACVVIAGQTYAFNPNGNSTAWRNDNIGGALDKYNSIPDKPKVKAHVILLTIVNKSGFELRGPFGWFDSGSLADYWKWPQSIPANDGILFVELYEKDNSMFAGCSGYVNYIWKGKTITFAFSNPYYGTNKVGVGTGGKSVWDNMGSHDYKPFTKKFTVDGVKLKAVASATGGNVNEAKIVLSYDN